MKKNRALISTCTPLLDIKKRPPYRPDMYRN